MSIYPLSHDDMCAYATHIRPRMKVIKELVHPYITIDAGLQVPIMTLMGCVLKGTQTASKSNIALKVCIHNFDRSGESICTGSVHHDSIKSEAVTLRTLYNHPHPNLACAREIPYMIVSGAHGMTVFVTPWCDKLSLIDSQISTSEPLPANIVRMYATQLIGALSHLHSLNIVHRDIASDNVFLTHDDRTETRAVLGDFGTSTSTTDSGRCTTNSSIPGRTMYKSRYVYALSSRAGRKSWDAKAEDVYAMGVVIYQMVMGKHLYMVPDLSDMAYVQFNRQGLSTICIPPPLHSLLSGMLQENPRDRVTAADAMAHPWISQTSVTQSNLQYDNSQQLLNRVDISSEHTGDDEYDCTVLRMCRYSLCALIIAVVVVVAITRVVR